MPVSIHAPTRGATSADKKGDFLIEFQSTHPHGVRLLVRLDVKKKKRVSIHAPTRGATKYASWLNRLTIVSIHAPTRGATDR